jgi:serine/threonine protein kinase
MSDKEVNDAIKEAQIMSSLDHPNIIHFEECFIMKKPKLSMCIVMDFANGKVFLTKVVT